MTLFSPCLFGHASDRHYGRDAEGRATWNCSRCGEPVTVREVGTGSQSLLAKIAQGVRKQQYLAKRRQFRRIG